MNTLKGLLAGCGLMGMLLSGAVYAEECSGTVSAEEVLAAEDARYAAQTSDDFAAMDKLFAADLVYIHSSAVVDNKASYIDSMQSGNVKYRKMQRSDVTVRTYGCVAIITGLANFDVTVKGKDLAVEIRFHSIWASREKGLQFISWEATRTPAKQ
ncbi:MAG TPA: nuclear transport factor 2 family protein [Burkholderiales bacterium]|nr:nuclear transport factor 2 family protein [Burkholderiales bacterium]